MACEHYDLDMTAARFGDCKCGHTRAEHSQASLHAGPVHHEKAAPAAHEAPEGDYHGPCDAFNVDMQATEFGLCKCGFKKIDHGKPKELFMTKKDGPHPPPPKPAAAAPPPAAVPPPAPPSRPKEHAETGKKPAPEPCNHFELDLQGTFGFCKCGHSREEHKQAGTLAPPEPRLFAGAHIQDGKRNSIAGKPGAHGKQAKPCDHYAVDTNGKTFGDCVCGHPKTKHKQFQPVKKGQNNDPDEEEVAPEPEPEAPRVIVRDGTHPCEVFELDLKNQGGYGRCICGFSRLDHEQFHSDPAEWHRVKASLTAPKEFT